MEELQKEILVETGTVQKSEESIFFNELQP